MAKYTPKDPVEILKIISSKTVYTLEDGSSVASASTPVLDQHMIIDTETVISDAHLSAEFVPAPLA